MYSGCLRTDFPLVELQNSCRLNITDIKEESALVEDTLLEKGRGKDAGLKDGWKLFLGYPEYF